MHSVELNVVETGMFTSFRVVEMPKADYDTSIRILKNSVN